MKRFLIPQNVVQLSFSLKRIVISLVSIFLSIQVLARDFEYTYEGQTIVYTILNETDRTCMTKSGSSSVPGNRVTGDLVLPSNPIDGDTEYSLTEIGNHSFIYNQDLTSVVIPNSVKSINESAFFYCSSLTSITFGSSLSNIGSIVFAYCGSLNKVEFASIESLCSIQFSDANSNPLTFAHNLNINGEEIRDITIPESVSTIGYYAFNGAKLTSVTIPKSVNSIGESAFNVSDGLNKVEFASIESLCTIQFANVTSNPLTRAHNLYINNEEITNVNIPESVSKIGAYSFSGGSQITSVTISNTVTSIGEGAFYNCQNLKEISISENITSIGDGAFECCNSLTTFNVDPKNELYKAKEGVLFNHDFSTLLAYPSVKGEYIIPDYVKIIGIGAFAGCVDLLSITIPSSVISINEEAFFGCSGLTNISIPESVNNIGEYAFGQCTGLTSIIIPRSIETLSYFLFYRCTGLKSVTIPNSVKEIGGWAFAYCSGLSDIEIPTSVTKIFDWGFGGCSSLTSITIPASIEYLGSGAFMSCSSLTSVYYGAEVPIEGFSQIFGETTYNSATLYVPESALARAKVTSPWGYFKNIVSHDFSSIDEIKSDADVDKAMEIYNMNGVRIGESLENLSSGIYIVRQGNIVKKIAVK